MLAWACGGGGDNKSPTQTSPAGPTAAAGETPQAAGGQFSGLSEKFAQADFKATFDVKSTGGGQGDFSGTMIMYKKGDLLREDFESESEGDQSTAIYITTPETSYVCAPASGEGETDTCFSAPTQPDEGAGQIIADLETVLNDSSLQVVSTSSRNIAGEDADCYTVRSPEFEGDAEICLSKEAVPLYTKSTSQGAESTLEATAFSRDVSDSDFQPPYPVTDTTTTDTP
jgi:outer membrane lipoprotein-sorting protein